MFCHFGLKIHTVLPTILCIHTPCLLHNFSVGSDLGYEHNLQHIDVELYIYEARVRITERHNSLQPLSLVEKKGS